jgi:hypothetical protein
MSNQRILGKIVGRVVLCWALLLALYFIHEMGHLVLYNMLSDSADGRILFDGARFAMYHPAVFDPIADRLIRAGGLLATLPAIILVRKKTPLLGMVALFWIVYGIYEAFFMVR